MDENTGGWTGKMAQWINYLLCKHEDLNLDPQNPYTMPGLAARMSVTPVLGRQWWEDLWGPLAS